MLDAAIVGLGRWGQILVNSVQEEGRPKGEALRFTRAVARTPGKVADFCATHSLALGDSLPAVLEEVAKNHASDMAANDFLDHTGSDGSRPSDRATRAGYTWQRIAENVAAGQVRAEDVAATWLESPGHCANLMDPRHTETGIAYAVNASGSRAIYWAQIYTAPK